MIDPYNAWCNLKLFGVDCTFHVHANGTKCRNRKMVI